MELQFLAAQVVLVRAEVSNTSRGSSQPAAAQENLGIEQPLP